MKMTGAQILVETLIEQGVDTVFGFPGGMVVDIYDKLYDKQDKIKHRKKLFFLLYSFFLHQSSKQLNFEHIRL